MYVHKFKCKIHLLHPSEDMHTYMQGVFFITLLNYLNKTDFFFFFPLWFC